MNENRVVAQLSNSAGEKEKKYMFYCEGCKLNHIVIANIEMSQLEAV
jgi:hypothetical protein